MEQAVQYLSIIMGRSEGFYELSFGVDDNRDGRYDRMYKTWVTKDTDPSSIKALLQQEVGKCRDVYVGVLPRVNPEGTSLIPTGEWLWADLDDKVRPEIGWDNFILQRGIPSPTMKVFTGNGYHYYWRLQEPVDATLVEQYVQRLAMEFGSDPVQNRRRLLRVPGTLNYKNWKPDTLPPVVELVSYEAITYSLSNFPTPDQTLAQMAGYTGACKYIFRADLLLPKYDNDESRLDAALATMLAGRGVPKEEAVRIFHTYPVTNVKRKSDPEYYVNRTVETAYARSLTQLQAQAGGSGRRGSWRRYSLDELLKVPRPPDLVRGLLTHGTMGILAAEPKLGKSFLVLQLARALAVGEPWFCFDIPEPKRVLYVEAELQPHMLADRLPAIFAGAPIRRYTNNFHVCIAQGADLTTDMDLLDEQIRATNPDLLIIDPIARFMKSDENSGSSIGRLLDKFDVYRDNGLAILLVHHTRKRAAGQGSQSLSDIRGSSRFSADVDTIMLAQPYFADKSGNSIDLTFELRAHRPVSPFVVYRTENGTFSVYPGDRVGGHLENTPDRVRSEEVRPVPPVPVERATDGPGTGSGDTRPTSDRGGPG